MRIRAEGWARNIAFGGHNLMEGAVASACPGPASVRGPLCIEKTDTGISLTQGRTVTMNGNFRLTVSLSEDDIARLFAIAFRDRPLSEVAAILSQVP